MCSIVDHKFKADKYNYIDELLIKDCFSLKIRSRVSNQWKLALHMERQKQEKKDKKRKDVYQFELQ